MASFKKWKTLQHGKSPCELTNRIYRITGLGLFSKDFGLKDQIRRASVSIMSNIAEGFERSGTAEFMHFLATAKGSAGEVRSQLYVALDQDYITTTDFEYLHDGVTQISRMIGGLMSYLRRSGIKGTKYKKLDRES